MGVEGWYKFTFPFFFYKYVSPKIGLQRSNRDVKSIEKSSKRKCHSVKSPQLVMTRVALW